MLLLNKFNCTAFVLVKLDIATHNALIGSSFQILLNNFILLLYISFISSVGLFSVVCLLIFVKSVYLIQILTFDVYIFLFFNLLVISLDNSNNMGYISSLVL